FAQYRKSHEIVRGLAAKDPDAPGAQANLAATLIMLGEMSLELRRDVQASLGYYQQALALQQAIAARPPDGKLDPTALRRELAEALGNVGVFALRTGDPAAAAAYLPRARALMAELAGQDEKNALYRRYLALADYRCATLAGRQGDPAAADRHNRDCKRVR